MPGFHPLYRQASPELLSFVDHHCGHGLFRSMCIQLSPQHVVGCPERGDEGGGQHRSPPDNRRAGRAA